MNMERLIKNILIAGILTFAFSSCNKLFDTNRTGTPIQFGATVEKGSTMTKTAYSGPDGVVDGKERIDWIAGDEIMIYMYYEYKNAWNNTLNTDDYKPGIEHKPYSIINPISPNGYISDAKVGTYGNPLVWKDDYIHEGIWENSVQIDKSCPTYHYFYGIYPALDNFDNNNKTVSFKIPPIQYGDMDLAFMAATTPKTYYTADGKGSVILQFYPMVTTLWFVLNNDTNEKQTIVSIDLEQDNFRKPLTGDFTCGLDGNRFKPYDYGWMNGGNKIHVEINKDIAENSSISIPIFIIPADRPMQNISVSVKMPNKVLANKFASGKDFQSCKKYNIPINLSGKGTEIDPEPVIPELPSDFELSNGGSQLFINALRDFLGNNDTYDLLAGFYAEHSELGISSGNDFLDKIWNTKIQNLLGDKFDNITMQDIIDAFGGKGALEILLNEMRKRSEVNLQASKDISGSISAKDLQTLFPVATYIKVQISENAKEDFSITVSDLPYLNKFEVLNANFEKLEISDCENFQELVLTGADSRLETITLKNLPKFQGGRIQGNNPVEITLTIDNCSQSYSGARLNFEGSYQGHVTKKQTNSPNLTVGGI